jgi:excinuclease ABC subunit C
MTTDAQDPQEWQDGLLSRIPENPGIYKFVNAKGKILYIGKAKNLRKRVRSYFNKTASSYRIATMVAQAVDVQYTVTNSEIDALLLENNLIKEHQPKYNINLKDGKTYPYICIRNERFPRVYHTRNRIEDGSTYYGPYPSGLTMHNILDLIRANFKLRTCTYVLSKENVAAKKYRLCLEYQIGNCAGPCEGLMDEATYNANIDAIRKILRGHLNPLIEQLHQQMMTHADAYEFEKAEELRQRIDRIRQYKQRNTIISESISDVEVLGLASLESLTIVTHFKVINGAIIQTHSWEVRLGEVEEGSTDSQEQEVLASVFDRLRLEDGDMGHEILSSHEFQPEDLPAEFKIVVPQRGDKLKLVELAIKNCNTLLKEKVLAQNFRREPPHMEAMLRLQQDLHLLRLPRHIECIDNSNIQGTDPVSSLVVFKDGKPSKKDYRHFKVRTVEGPDDFKTMEEVVTRRFTRLIEEKAPLPDLLIVDGGKGQLSHASAALEALGLIEKVPIVGIAKKLEEIYFRNDPVPLHIDKRSPALKLIQQLRNEAHRFGITFHRDLRSKRQRSTSLTEVPGIGEATAKKLLAHFRSVKKVREATLEELAAVIGPAKAKAVQESLAQAPDTSEDATESEVFPPSN